MTKKLLPHYKPEGQSISVFTTLLVILSLFLISHFSSMTVPTVHADGFSVQASPSLLQIRANSPADVRAPFTIENKSNSSMKLRIGYKIINPDVSKEGTITYLTEGQNFNGLDKKIFEKMEVIDDEQAIDVIELGPKQQKKLTLRILLPENQPVSDYYFSLVFISENPAISQQNRSKTDKKDQKSITQLAGGVGINVLLAIGSDENAQGSIETFSTPWYVNSGPISFSVKVKNTGQHFVNPKGIIFIKNIFGQTVGRIDIPQTPVLAGTERSLGEMSQNTSKAIEERKVQWPEKILLGLYTAELSIAMSPNGPVYNEAIRFAAFPIPFFIGLVLLILLSYFWYRKLRKRHLK